jgi:SPP1 gp7 family putative phage head morphogenesis protein
MAKLLEKLGLMRRADVQTLVAQEVARLDTMRGASVALVAPVAPPAPSVDELARAIVEQSGLSNAVSPGSPDVFAFNNPTNYTVAQSPERRPKSQVTITTLRALADNYDILRACIEHLKREVSTVPIVIASKSGDSSDATQKRIAQAQTLFTLEGGVGRAQCDPEHFEQSFLEDAIVVGSPAIYHRYTRGGEWLWCDVVDAATIRPVTDSRGWEPEGGLYEQWIMGVKTGTFTARDLSFDKLAAVSWQPYSRSPVEWLIHTVNRALRIDGWNLTWFTEGTTPADLLSLPEQWTPEQIITFTNWFNALNAGNTSERVKTKFVPGGTGRLGAKSGSEFDFTAQELWLLRRTCGILGVQPASIGFTGEQYKVSQDESMHATTQFGAGILLRLRKRRYDDILTRAGFGDLETVLPEKQTEKPKERAEREEIEIRSGKRTINEVRQADGLDAIEGGDVTLVASTLKPLVDALTPPPTPDPTLPPAPAPDPARTRLPAIRRRESLDSAAARYRAAMQDHCDEATSATLAYWQDAEKVIRAAWDAMIERQPELIAAGVATPQQLAGVDRYRELLTQINEQITALSVSAATATSEAQRAGVATALTGAPTLAAVAAGPAPAGASLPWTALPVDAIEALIGFASDGSPLQELFADIGPDIAQRATQALVNGLASGEGIEATARALDPILNVGRARARNIAHTETMRAMRQATAQSYAQNTDVLEGWIWTASLTTRTCPACWAMHGTEHPASERLDGHQQCRCAMVPKVRSWSEILGDASIPDDRPVIETGEEAFQRLSENDQRSILGDGLYALWSEGSVSFDALAVRTEDPRWGASVRPITVAEAAGRSSSQADLKRWEKKALNRLRESGSAACTFASDALSPGLIERLSRGLTAATTPDDVRALFRATEETS